MISNLTIELVRFDDFCNLSTHKNICSFLWSTFHGHSSDIQFFPSFPRITDSSVQHISEIAPFISNQRSFILSLFFFYLFRSVACSCTVSGSHSSQLMYVIVLLVGGLVKLCLAL